jgi:hypothetical protein
VYARIGGVGVRRRYGFGTLVKVGKAALDRLKEGERRAMSMYCQSHGSAIVAWVPGLDT